MIDSELIAQFGLQPRWAIVRRSSAAQSACSPARRSAECRILFKLIFVYRLYAMGA